ncbi:hypothetical protein [Exiguobacterium sp. s192]|uniref:hypothetical protein n=1 Tax=Exiguobacterium sp. s192 TaxID=2751206 RepID=UPI001BE6674F|nr:hypothetical protein [Exiguobacterium sp. s192]
MTYIQGRGNLRLEEAEEVIEVESDFNLNFNINNVWDKNRNDISVSTNSVLMCRELPVYPWNFEGVTTDGKTFSAKKIVLVNQNENCTQADIDINLKFDIGEIVIGNNLECEMLEYYIPNFVIGFDEMTESFGIITRNKTQFSLSYNQETISVEILENNNLVTRMTEIERQNEDVFTVKIVLRKESGRLNLDEGNELMDLILDLCSIAYGGKVRWGTVKGYSNNAELFRIIRNGSFAPLKPHRQLIEVKYPRGLSRFVQSCFPTYVSLTTESRSSLKKISAGIQLSASNLIFPIPYIVLGSVIEEFVSEELEETVSGYLGRAQRRGIYSEFKLFLEENVIPLIGLEDVNDFDDSGMKQKWNGLLTRNLRSRIINLLDTFEVEYDAEKVRSFVRNRNNAAHGNYEYGSNDYLVWSQMVALLEQVIMKKLDYRGSYYDWSVSPPNL